MWQCDGHYTNDVETKQTLADRQKSTMRDFLLQASVTVCNLTPITGLDRMENQPKTCCCAARHVQQ